MEQASIEVLKAIRRMILGLSLVISTTMMLLSEVALPTGGEPRSS